MNKTNSLSEKSKGKLKDNINQFINSARLKKGLPDGNNIWASLTSIKDILRHDSLEIFDLYMFASNELTKFIEQKTGKPSYKFSGNLCDLFDKKELSNIKQIILKKLLTLPWGYEVLVPLYGTYLPTTKPIEICEFIQLISLTKADIQKYSERFINIEQLPEPKLNFYEGNTVLILQTKGYAYDISGSTLFSSSVSVIKQLVSAMIIKGILREIERFDASLFAAFVRENYKEAWWINPIFPNELPISIHLPNEQSYFLRKLEINPEIFNRRNPLDLLAKIKSTGVSDDRKHNILQNEMKICGNLFSDMAQDSKTDDERRRVRTSLEWFFDGLVNENKTFSFIQYSIAIEALLGEANEKKDVVERLADRCSFLIAKDSSERKKIKQKFRDAYSTRSEIIHQGKAKLSGKELTHHSIMDVFLKKALLKEMQNLPQLPK